MFDLSFTQDQQWIEGRSRLWAEVEPGIKEGLSKREVQRWKDYFFTGIVAKSGKYAPGALVEFFPSFSKEGIAYCLKNNMSEKIGDDEYRQVQALFETNIHTVAGLTRGAQLELFKYVFGESYDPERKFPFLIGSESEYRAITLHPNLLFESLCSTNNWLKRKHVLEPIWPAVLDYGFSLIPYVDTRIFRIGEANKSKGEYLDGGVRSDIAQAKLIGVSRYCFKYPDPTEGAPEGESRRQFLREFRERMENLNHYPGDLKALWESVKAEYA